ncbi:MAG TPA: carboxypeptidase-like regulatory domain-containing protein [Acidobacteriota bacterium]|nr:carboxypeptidase-like regulatory domain-containing protein [Acidobacteriota bacterium]
MKLAVPCMLAIALFLMPAAFGQEESGIYGVVRSLTPDGLYGEPLAGAAVTAFDSEGSRVTRSITEPNGAYRLVVPPGNYRLTARHPAFADFDTAGAVLLVQSGHFTLFNIGMQPRESGIGAINGLVIDNDGQPVAAADVVLSDQEGTEVTRIETGGSGEFSMDVAPGSYRIGSEHPIRGVAEPIGVEVRNGATVEMQIRLTPPPEPLGSFQGLIRVRAEGGAAGRPIVGAEVFATGEGGLRLGASTNEIGFYKISLPSGRYRLSVSHPDFVTAGSGEGPLAVVSDTVVTWNALLEPSVPLTGVQLCRDQFPVSIGSSYGELHTVFLRVNSPGPVNIVYRWVGDARELALIALGPDGVPRRVDGVSPLRLTTEVSNELIALGFQWEISVRNFGGGRAEGTVTISYPCKK